MYRVNGYRRHIAGLTAIAASLPAHAAPRLQHNYEFSGLMQEESFASSHRLGEQINATIESKTKYHTSRAYAGENLSEQKIEIGYRHEATDSIFLSPVAAMEGNETRMKNVFRLDAYQALTRNLGIGISHGYEEQRHFGENSLPDQYRSVSKANLKYHWQRLKINYSFTHKASHGYFYESKDQIIEHEMNLEYAVCSMLNPYLKLESLESFSAHSERETSFWLGIKRIWR